jgi:pimeloyl-ACP methyl ester carboxylesterase
MSRWSRAGKAALFVAGSAAAAAGALYGAQALAARRLRNRPDPRGAETLAPLPFAARPITSFDGTTISVVEAGAGPPVVLVHGVTLSVRTWVHQLRTLPARGYRAIAVDQRGHGASILGDAGHAVEHLGDDLMHVVRELDLHGAVLVGHSMGGIAVQSFAIRHPDLARERIRGLVLLSTLCKTPLGSQATRARASIERLTRRTPDTTRLWSSPRLGLLLARVGFGRDPAPGDVELVRQMLSECANDTRIEAPRALIGMDLTGELPKVELPTLVICGTADVITPPFHSRQIHTLLPNARLELVEGGGHMLMLERTDTIDALIDAFAREVGATPEPA